MTQKDPELLLVHAPLLRQGMTTPRAMRDVIYALAAGDRRVAVVLRAERRAGARSVDRRRRAGRSAVCTTVKRAARRCAMPPGLLTGLLLGLSLPPGPADVDGLPRRLRRDQLRQGHLGRPRAQPVQSGACRSGISARHLSAGDDHVGQRRQRRRLHERLRQQPGIAVHAGEDRCGDRGNAARHAEVRATGDAARQPDVRQNRRLARRDQRRAAAARRRIPVAAQRPRLAHPGQHPAHRRAVFSGAQHWSMRPVIRLRCSLSSRAD